MRPWLRLNVILFAVLMGVAALLMLIAIFAANPHSFNHRNPMGGMLAVLALAIFALAVVWHIVRSGKPSFMAIGITLSCFSFTFSVPFLSLFSSDLSQRGWITPFVLIALAMPIQALVNIGITIKKIRSGRLTLAILALFDILAIGLICWVWNSVNPI